MTIIVDNFIYRTLPPKLWTPAEITTELWLNANTDNITTAAGSVIQWHDKSGDDHLVDQIVTASQPSTGIVTINGKNTITFANDFFNSAYVATNSLQKSVYVVIRGVPANTGSFPGIITWKGTYPFSLTSNTAQGRYGTYNGVLATSQSSATSLLNDVTACIAAHRLADGTGVFATNSVDDGVFADALSTTSQAIGRWNTALSASIGEIIVAPNEDFREEIEGYQAWEYGTVADLPVSHPYKNEPPTV